MTCENDTRRSAHQAAGPHMRRLQNAVWNWIAELITSRALKALEAELCALDDRLLKDIGLHRSEIGGAVRHGAGKRQRSQL